jgi:hypothetical protein
MKVMYGDNLGKTMEGADKQSFFDFIQALHQFAVRNFWTFSSEDLSKLKYVQAGMAAIKEGLFEGYYGNRRVSYTGEATEARMMIRHNRVLGENDARFRYIESIYIETADSERFKLPFTNMTGARAMLEHVRQGGRPYDVRGNHICEMVSELKVLNRFNRASAGRVMEGVTQAIVEQAQAYYQSLRESLKRLGHGRGYTAYFESWHPAEIGEHESLVEDIKTMFVEQTLDTRIEAALPLLARIQQQGNAMKEAEIFESWINNLAEGTWNLPETPEQVAKLKDLMSQELIVGPDATNATEQLYDLIGDDELFDRLGDLAQRDPRANAWNDTDVMDRLRELGIETETQAPAGAEGDAAPVDPAVEPVPQQPVAEDMSRRGFLRGLGAAAAGAAGIGAAGNAQGKVTFDNGKQINPPDWKNFQGTAPAQGAKPLPAAPAAGLFKSQSAASRAAAEEAANAAAKIRYTNPKFREEFERIEKTYQQTKSIVLNNKRPYSANPDLAKRQHAESMKILIAADTEFAEKTNALIKQYGGIREQDVTEGSDLDAMRKAAGLPVSEGRILDEGGETLGHIMDRFKHEVDQFEKGGDLDNDLYYALFDYYSDHGEIPYGIAKGRDGDPFEWVTDRLDQELGTGNHAPRVSEADALATFEVMSGFDAPVAEGSCNMTAEGEYCPEHALAECGGMHEMGTVAGSVAPVMGESRDSDALLARIKSLALIR